MTVYEYLLGKELNSVAFLGGSITLGYRAQTNYAKEFMQELNKERVKNSLPEAKVLRIGNCGCTSLWGMFQLSEILEEKPNVLFLEFSVNDYKDAKHREVFEGMVRRALRQGVLPIVLVLVSQYDYTCRSHMTKIARQYAVPMLDVGVTLLAGIQDGSMTWQEYADDYIHPNNGGQKYIAKVCKKQLAETNMRDLTLPVEEAFFSNRYENFTSEQGAVLDAKQMKFSTTFYGGEVFLCYQKTREKWAGMFQVTIDGKAVGIVDTFDFTAWGNPVVESFSVPKLASETKKDSHTIQLEYVNRKESDKVIIHAVGSVRELQVP